jgi:hypothetical protein
MHQHKLHYNVQTCQVKIAGVEFNQIVAIKEQTLPALTSTVITAIYKGKVNKDAYDFWYAGNRVNRQK